MKKPIFTVDGDSEEDEIDGQDLGLSFLYNVREQTDNTGSVNIYIADGRKFVKDIEFWAFNRPIDEEHVENIFNNYVQDMKENKVLPNLRTICVGYRKDENVYYLLDGQHRIRALKKFLKKYSSKKVNVIIEVHSLSDEDETVSLFNQVNNSKILQAEETPHKGAMKIITKIKKEYAKFVFSESSSTYYPKIDPKKMHKHLKRVLMKGKITEEELYEKIMKKNNVYRKRYRSGKSIPNYDPERNIKAGEKVEKHGFYICLDRNFEWIKEIEYDGSE